MPSNPRDTLSGRLMAELPEEEQERVWIRRLEGVATTATQNSNEFRASLKTRQARRDDQAEYLKEAIHPSIVEQEKEDEAMAGSLDITEFGSWFQENNYKIQTKNLRFYDYGEWAQLVQNNPKIWFSFVGYLQSLILWSDKEISLREERSRDWEEKYNDIKDQSKNKRERYRKEILLNQDNIKKLRNENAILQQKIKELSVESLPKDKISSDSDSDEEFFQKLTPRHIHSPKLSARTTKSPTPASINVVQGSNSCPSKIDPFNGTREKYEEWIGKLVGQINAAPEYFEDREDRKLNYFMQHLTGPAYDLVKDDFGPRARAENPTLNLENAINQLDRAYFPVDKYRTARAKLEKLKMGYNESFAEFYPKFQVQINRLQLKDEHKVDELTKRLSKRFADKVLTGTDESYYQVVNRCYKLDSQLDMWAASHNSEANSDRN